MRYTAWSGSSLLAALLLATACVAPASPPPLRVALGTPAERVAAESFAAVLDPAGGPPFGAAVAIGPRRLLTSAHVACEAVAAGGTGTLRLQRGDGATEATAAVLAVSDRSGLAVLATGTDFAAPATEAPEPPRLREPVWAVGPHRLGRALAGGPVTRPGLHLPGLGGGFVARLPALMGFSGGPVVDREGRLVGLVTAAIEEPLGATLAARLTGLDIGGLAFGTARQIFVLGAAEARAEAARLLADRDGPPAGAPHPCQRATTRAPPP